MPSVVVDPSTVVALQQRQLDVTTQRTEPSRSRRPSPSPYAPLPTDRAGFEAFMREQERLRGTSGTRLNWNQQETLLIPRESLEPEPPPPNRQLYWVLAGGALLSAIVVLIVLLRTGDARQVRAIQLATNSAAQASTTLIATEPSGAELLQSGAVLGNTPLRVPRPASGDATFLVRMHGFESELVRLTPQSNPAIRVTLRPAAAK